MQRTPRMKQKGPLVVFVSQEKDKRLPFDNTLYLIPLLNYREENATSCPIAKVSTFVRSPNTSHPPLTSRKDNTAETIANCCLDCGLSCGCIRQFILQLDITGLFSSIEKSAPQQQA